ANQFWVGELRCAVGPVISKHISCSYLCRVTILPIWLVLLSDVVGEGFFSPSAIICAAASADLVFSVEDDPHGLASPALAEVQTGSFGFTRHLSLICLMASNVTNCFPAIISYASVRRLISRLRPETVIPPRGKASATASFSLSGVVSS